MAEEKAIWHVIVGDVQQGPLTKVQVFELLKSGTLLGTHLGWRPGFPEWTPLSQINEFWRPPPRAGAGSEVPAQSQSTMKADHIVDQPPATDEASVGKKWSLWTSASIGLGLSVLLLIPLIANDGGYELASYARTRSPGTVGNLMGRILVGPIIFILVALIRNAFAWRQPRSSASAVKGALIFATLLAVIFAALFLYGLFFFSSTEAIRGEARQRFIESAQRTCAQRQRSISQGATEAQIQSFCACYSAKMADITTYKQMSTELDANALADMRQKAEAAGSACR
jgi:hypothetical protein